MRQSWHAWQWAAQSSMPTRSSVMEQCDVPLRLQHRQKLLEGTRTFRELYLVNDFMGKLPHIAARPPSYKMPKMHLQKGGMTLTLAMAQFLFDMLQRSHPNILQASEWENCQSLRVQRV